MFDVESDSLHAEALVLELGSLYAIVQLIDDNNLACPTQHAVMSARNPMDLCPSLGDFPPESPHRFEADEATL